MVTRALTKSGEMQGGVSVRAIEPGLGDTVKDSLTAALLFVCGLLALSWVGFMFWLTGYALGVW
jgi:hypothetical protein